MTLGRAPTQTNLLSSSSEYCRELLHENSLYSLLERESHRIFPDESFADLFQNVGRRSIPPRIVAVVMVLQRAEGLSDREAVDRFSFDLRWKFAAGGLDYDYPSFAHTVLVNMRERLRRSERPDRIFEVVLEICRQAGMVGQRRAFDSTALYDAVATQDTVTLIRSAIRGLLQAADSELGVHLRAALKRDDDYQQAGKPVCAWDDREARQELVDELAKDGYAVLGCLDGMELATPVSEAGRLLATVLGQDLEQTADGTFRIARGVAADRVISTVDPESRHGHKTAARGFDGYKGHISEDPDSEIIVVCDVTAGNVGDGQAATPLVDEVIEQARSQQEQQPAVEAFGDASYGTAEIVERLEEANVEVFVKVQQPAPPKKGLFSKSEFDIDLKAQTVSCPAGKLVAIRTVNSRDVVGRASFGKHCADCPLRDKCTTSKEGRVVRIHPSEDTLQRNRKRQKSPEWKQHYRSIRPKVERKFGHLMRRHHGGRRARVRGTERVRADFSLLCAVANLQRLAVMGVTLGDEHRSPSAALFDLLGRLWELLGASNAPSCRLQADRPSDRHAHLALA